MCPPRPHPQDYNDLMDVTEEMISGMVHSICGSYKVMYEPADGEGFEEKEVEVDFTPPWPRLNMIDEIERRGGFSMPRPLDGKDCNDFLKAVCEKLNVECGAPQSTARLLDKLVGHFLEENIVNPTFITCHPVIMSPLAKYHRERPELTERLELFVLKKEVANAYTELNNPKVQRERFEDQLKQKDKGDDEAMEYDEGFCEAMEYGLPPTAGWGLGIDRMTMFLSNSNNIKEVMLFPQMKPRESSSSGATAGAGTAAPTGGGDKGPMVDVD